MADSNKCKTILAQAVSYSSISITVMLAKESGIMSTLIKAEHPLSSQDIARENNLKERYTREILGCLSSAEIIRVTSENDDGVPVYDLDSSSKEVMTQTTSLEMFNLLKTVCVRYDKVKECAQADKDGALRYSQDYFFDLLDKYKEIESETLVNTIVNKVTGLVDRLESGIDVAEVGCGNANALSKMATMFPRSTFTATDVQTCTVENLKQKYQHISNMKFHTLDLRCSPDTIDDKRYDLVLSIDVLHDLPHPGHAMKVIRRMVKDTDGVFVFEDMAGTGNHLKDVGRLDAAMMYGFGTFMCIPESFQDDDSEAHGPCWALDTCLELVKEAGFRPRVVQHEGFNVLIEASPM